MSLIESAKKSAAHRAVAEHLDPSFRWVGIGSGSTVVHVVDAIAALPSEVTAPMTFVPTGDQSKLLITTAGLRLGAIDLRPLDPTTGKVRLLDVAFDGADEVDEDLNLIKGGGACLWQEKFVACAAKKFVCVADYRKISPRLCTKWKTIPIEVHPLTAIDVLRELRAMGSAGPVIRQGGTAKAGPVVTDNGMWLIDAPFPPLLLPKDLPDSEPLGTEGTHSSSWEVTALAQKLKSLLGVVEIGLFYGYNGPQALTASLDRAGQKPVAAYFGMENGEVMVQTALE